jgi:MFS family permease
MPPAGAKPRSTLCPSPVTKAPCLLALALGGLIALAAAVGIGRFVYTPILPLVVDDLGMTKGAAGLLASANFAGYLAGALVAATPVMAGSRRRWLLLALTVCALTTGAMAFASSAVAFLPLRFVGGIASACVLVLASALVLDRLNAAGRPDLAAVHFAGVGAGMALSAVLGLIRARHLSSGGPRRTVAVMAAAFGLGQIVGPLFAGVVYDTTGTCVVPARTAVSALLVGALLAVAGSKQTL